MSGIEETGGASAREKLLQAAAQLFYNDGIAATGIDAITHRAGVAKQSLYNNFASKADLVAAYIDARHAEWLDLYAAREATAHDAKEKILAVFDAYEDHAEFAYERGFRGCGLLNAAAELTADDAGRAAVRRHKLDVDVILKTQLGVLLPDQPDRVPVLAEHFAYLVEGAMARAGLDGNGERVRHARAIAVDMLEAL
ncbi:TetR/AcrR family transcriptional regulator [Breoghania sp. JC706]|uniref:TetR/AcrR family transcriptional regulator n=1 Tax=Breoghania sp. JC706 TaxID=3117732 RepID=UPI00300A3D30